MGQCLNDDVVGDPAAVDQAADKIEIGLGRGREADLDFFDADFQQQVEETVLFLLPHRVDQRLIAIAQIGRKPARGFVDRLGWPGAVGQINLRKGPVFAGRVG